MKDPDSYGLFQIFGHFKNKAPGSLVALHKVVVRSLRAGEEVPVDVLLALLEALPPKQTEKQRQQVALLRYVDTVQAFFNVPDSLGESQGVVEPAAFRAAVARAQALLKKHETSELNEAERYFITQELDQATDHLTKIRDRMK